jgi:hypothetical protein
VVPNHHRSSSHLLNEIEPRVFDAEVRVVCEHYAEALSNMSLETVELLQEALTPSAEALLLGRASVRLQRLAGFSWWVEAVNTL